MEEDCRYSKLGFRVRIVLKMRTKLYVSSTRCGAIEIFRAFKINRFFVVSVVAVVHNMLLLHYNQGGIMDKLVLNIYKSYSFNHTL